MPRRPQSLGSLGPRPAAVTALLARGDDAIVAVGLCGRLRGWQRRRPPPRPVELTLSATSSSTVRLSIDDPSAAADEWELKLDESSSYELANNRRSSAATCFLTLLRKHTLELSVQARN